MENPGSEILSLARQAVEHYVRTGGFLPPPADPPPALKDAGAVFVSLRVDRTLRGCIGTLLPTKPTLAEEVIANAVAAAVSDPRFPAVSPEELPGLSYEVDILGPLVQVSGEDELDPEQYGVVVESGRRRGVLLPALEGVTSREQQVAIARVKAGIGPHEPVNLYRFTVTRFREEE
ncbi:MAG: AmmeMemoRadiSam system protein A [Candidatus Rokubacteria bacterium]|nr:AmmeMemoRadiSam system protein A [Candidatus Rokubacteria bacterium]